MNIGELFSNLTYGELSTSSIGGKSRGGIADKDRPEMMNHVNFALTRLYTDLPLKTKALTLLIDGVTSIYFLQSRHLVSGHANTSRYLSDSRDDPFTDDIILVSEIKGVDGNVLYRNSGPGNEGVVYSPTQLTVQYPSGKLGDHLDILYQARHPKLPDDTSNDYVLELPEAYIPCLGSAIAARALTNNSSKGAIGKDYYESRYREYLQGLKLVGATPTSDIDFTGGFEENGWI